MDWNNLIITDIFDVLTVRIEKGVRRQITNRKGYGISFCATPGGKIVYSHNGRQFISDYDHAVILPKGQTYILNGIQTGDFPLINFQCTPAFCMEEFETFPVSNISTFLRNYDLINSYYIFQHPVHRLESYSLLYQIFGQLMIHNPDNHQHQLLIPAIHYLEEHYMDHDLSVELLAKQAHISVTYFRRMFKTLYAVSPKQYIINTRIGKAKELLRNSHYSVSAIALDCGFGGECHFCRVFKEYVGCSPSEYRNQTSQML